MSDNGTRGVMPSPCRPAGLSTQPSAAGLRSVPTSEAEGVIFELPPFWFVRATVLTATTISAAAGGLHVPCMPGMVKSAAHTHDLVGCY